MIIENVPLCRDHRATKQVEALTRAGYEVSVICRADPGNRRFRGTPRLCLEQYVGPRDRSGKIGFIWEYVYSLLAATVLTAKTFLKTGFDAIQAGHPPDIYSLLALPYRALGRPFVVDQRDLSLEMYRSRYGHDTGALPWAIRHLERFSWRTADRVICVNRSMRSAILLRGAIPRAAVAIVGNGPTLSSTRPRPAKPELKRGRRFLVCWVGLMGPQDHVDVALTAVHHVIHTLGRRDSHFVFIGDGEMLPALKHLAADLDLQPWTTFTGWLEREACFDYLATADLALDPNTEPEVSPVKGMEYMAFRVPCVAFDVHETKVMAGEAAAYVQPGDVLGLATTIDSLLDRPDRRREMGAVGRRRIEERLAWDRQERTYVAVYDRLLGGAGRNVQRATYRTRR